MLWLLGTVFVFVLLLGMPVSFGMGFIAVLYIVVNGDFSLATVPQKIVSGMDSFLLLAIPFFLLAGSLMNHGGITARLVRFASTLVGHIPGGLGQVTVVSNMIMSGMSGSAAADTVATGSVLIPSMVRQGYSRGFAAAITACAATMGPIIPPSIAFVIYGSLTGVSVGQLFLGGCLPGIVMALYLMAAVWAVARKRGYTAAPRRATGAERWRAFVEAGPALMTPFWVLGGMVLGIVTPTEAAAVAALYAFLVGFWYGELKFGSFPRILTETVVMTSVVYLLLGVFNLLGWILAVEGIPQTIAHTFLELTENWVVVLLIINIVLLVLGTVMEPVPLMILLGPMLMPVIKHYEIDPVHFGVVFVLNICIGVVSPPIGTNMFIACSIAKCSVGEFTREGLAFMAALIVALFFITYVPWVTLALPELLMR